MYPNLIKIRPKMYIHYICLINVCVYFLIYVQHFSIYLFLSGIFLYYSNLFIFIVFFFLFISSLKICAINVDIYLFTTSPSKSISSLLPTKLGVVFLICQVHLVPLLLSQICSLPLEHNCPTWGDTLNKLPPFF